jgi:NAD(P)-dependent dehydrogenase (short-subunit alcohol dehydrogenase family)
VSIHNFLVIGGNSGIGAGITKLLSEDGDQVYSCSRSDSGNSSPDNIFELSFDAINGKLPLDRLPDHLDGIAYCPGTINLRPFARLKRDDFWADYQTNVMGAVNVIQEGLPLLRKSPSQTSIVLFSTVAVQTGMPFHASVACAKGAIEGLTRSLAAEFAPRIRVNAIAPSLTDTPLAGPLLASPDKRKAAEDRHPLKSIGNPHDIAQLAVFLLSKRAAWISGQILHVDGGMGALRTFK